MRSRLGRRRRKAEDGHRIAMDVKTGDKNLLGKRSNTEIKSDGKDLMFMKESDILSVRA